MKQLVLAVILIIISGCSKVPDPSLPSAQAQSTPSSSLPDDGEEPGSSRNLKISVTVSSPDEIKVREGDMVTIGQVLADRAKQREQLNSNKALLKLRISKLSVPTIKPLDRRPAPEISNLPAPTFLQQLTDIQAAELKLKQSQQKHNQQQRKIDMFSTLETGSLPPQTIQHETEKLAEKQRDIDRTESELNAVKARLETAQQERRQHEYQHSLKLSERAVSIEQQELERHRQELEWDKQERDREFQLAQLQTQLDSIETQITLTAEIRSNFNGKIRKIKFVSQRNDGLSYELQLAINRDGKKRASPQATDQGTR